MKKKLFLLFVTFSFFGVITVFSQEDYEYFVNNAGRSSALYKGAIPLKYVFVYTGTYYAYEKEYIKGNIIYNGKEYKNVRLNLNAHLDELIVWDEIAQRGIQLNKNYVDSFSIGNRKFVYIKNADQTGIMAPGYYQLLYNNSIEVYKKIIKIYGESVNQEYISSSRGIIRKFYPVTKYYVKNSMGASTINRKRDIIALYPDLKKEIRKYVHNNGLVFRGENMDNSLVSIFSFIDSNYNER
jgi:hypothetical protein